MLRNALERVLSRFAPRLLPGSTLHREALAAAAVGRLALSARLFEAGAMAYRRELHVEGLARLRVHQSLVRARSSGMPSEEAERMLEIVRSLNRLDRLESLRAPFEPCDAREVLSEWLADGPLGDGPTTVERAA